MNKILKILSYSIFAITILIFILTLSSRAAEFNEENNNINDTNISLEELYTASDTFLIENSAFIPEIYIWRDFMPGVDKENEKGIFLSLKIKFEKKIPFIEKLKSENLWIIYNNVVYFLTLSEVNSENHLVKEFYLKDGPVIEANKYIDVIFKLLIEKSEYMFIIRKNIINVVY